MWVLIGCCCLFVDGSSWERERANSLCPTIIIGSSLECVEVADGVVVVKEGEGGGEAR